MTATLTPCSPRLFAETLSTTPTWFELWMRSFEPAAGTWHHRGADSAVAVPYRVFRQSAFGLPIPTAGAAANSHTPRYDILGTPIDAVETLSSMMEELGVACLIFPYLSPCSRLLTALSDTGAPLWYSLEPCEVAPYVATSGDWDAYWGTRGNSRREWGRRERRLLEDGARIQCLQEWTEVAPIFDSILAIEASGWKGREKSAIVQSEDTRAFYWALAEQWAKDGYLRLFVMYLHDEPIAFELDAEFSGILHCFKHGYQDTYAKRGPGQVLRMHVLRWAFSEPEVKIFDMFGPDTESKRKWATDAETLQTLRVYRKSPRGTLAWARFSLAPRMRSYFRQQTHT